MYRSRTILMPLLAVAWLLAGCRTEETVFPSEEERLPVRCEGGPSGIYLLNEGNMGSNKATLDFIDLAGGRYVRNLYGERNPEVVKELGDVGNDLQIYGSRMYAVINCSHKVEVMDSRTCRRIGQVEIPNCRYVAFAGGKAYVSSYVGPVGIDPDAQRGAVYEVDTATLAVTRQVTVGYQPEQLLVDGNWLYVANSGGYRAPDYDSTVSVINLTSFRQVEKIPVAPNLHCLGQDAYGQIWVTSRGNYGTVPPRLYVLKDRRVVDVLDIPCAGFDIVGDSLYYYTSAPAYGAAESAGYGIINVRSRRKVSEAWITDGTDALIRVPYTVRVNPYNRDIYVTDAKNYVSSGVLYCFSREGVLRWQMRTGDIPAHLCFLLW